MTRRALLGAGALALAGCGDRASKPPPAPRVLARLLDAELAVLAAYRAVPAADREALAALARRATARAAALRRAGAPARPAPAPLATASHGDVGAREHAALVAYVAALPDLPSPALRRVAADGVQGTARAEALLRGRPQPSPFPGQPA